LNITIKQGNLSAEVCDAIVNPTRNSMFPNGGLDTIIHQKFGAFFSNQVNSISNEMQDNACPVGQSRIFIAQAERDPNAARYVINTVGPNYRKEGKDLAAFHLQSCYCTSLSLANTYGLSSIAYPAISCGAFHFPPHEAAQVGIEAIRQNSYQIKDVRFVLFDPNVYNAFVQEWINYSVKINKNANACDDRDRDRPRTPPPPQPTLTARPSARFCLLCKGQPLSADQQHLCSQCSGLTRSEIFNTVLQQLCFAAEKSFNDLKKECHLLKSILASYPLAYTPARVFDQSIHKRDSVAECYLQSYCDKKFREAAMPMAVLGDGNCFYNTFVKLAGAGTTTEASSVTPVELRARNVIELILNEDEYKRKYPQLTNFLDPFQGYVVTEMVHDTNYAAVWDFFSIATVLNIHVTSVYPKVNGNDDLNYQNFNDQQFSPLINEDRTNNNQTTTESTNDRQVKLLFSHCNRPLHLGGNNPPWAPNHFVPLLSLK
jgi:O-acetyl-ADP-ribose deacetylase (regulator of RNase III)